MGKLKNLMRELFAEFDIEREEHERTYDESEMRDFTDIYIRECRRAKRENDTGMLDNLVTVCANIALVYLNFAESSFYNEQGANNFRNVLFDLFLAGSETTSTSMVFTVHYCLHHPSIVRKLQDEIDKVIGRDRMPQAEDREKVFLSKLCVINYPIILIQI